MVPAENVPEAQHDGCAQCWANQFGSHPQGAGKACRNGVRVAVVQPDGEGDIMVLDLSPTSIKAFSGYITGLARSGVPPFEVITHLGTREEASWTAPTYQRPDIISDQKLIAKLEDRLEEATEIISKDFDPALYKKPVAKKVGGKRR
jgi:hypothetical protein